MVHADGSKRTRAAQGFLAVTLLLTIVSCGGGSTTTPPPAVTTPAISSVSPATGTVGMPVIIIGQRLSGTTAVSFNGTAAAFSVVGNTQINASVPAGATTGKISVTTPGGS